MFSLTRSRPIVGGLIHRARLHNTVSRGNGGGERTDPVKPIFSDEEEEDLITTRARDHRAGVT